MGENCVKIELISSILQFQAHKTQHIAYFSHSVKEICILKALELIIVFQIKMLLKICNKFYPKKEY